MNVDVSTHKDIHYNFKNDKLSTLLSPDKITYFHVYTKIKNELELASIESFLVTQNLEKCKLTVWLDYDISDNQLLLPYLEHVELKVYNPIVEAIDTLFDEVFIQRSQKMFGLTQ